MTMNDSIVIDLDEIDRRRSEIRASIDSGRLRHEIDQMVQIALEIGKRSEESTRVDSGLLRKSITI